jgi:hypothetical protein
LTACHIPGICKMIWKLFVTSNTSHYFIPKTGLLLGHPSALALPVLFSKQQSVLVMIVRSYYCLSMPSVWVSLCDYNKYQTQVTYKVKRDLLWLTVLEVQVHNQMVPLVWASGKDGTSRWEHLLKPVFISQTRKQREKERTVGLFP